LGEEKKRGGVCDRRGRGERKWKVRKKERGEREGGTREFVCFLIVLLIYLSTHRADIGDTLVVSG